MLRDIDVTLIATRRPELVDLTLRSFQQNLFSRVRCRRLVLNIDPLWGSDDDDREVERICRRFFADVDVRRPASPSFGGAVKWAWSRPTSEWFLHLEDDWLLARGINPATLATELSASDVGQVQLANLSRSQRARKIPLEIATSPGFVRSAFAEIAVRHMNPDMDPEKQFYEGHNPAGLAEMIRFRTKFYGDAGTPKLLYDTGRVWRKVRGIKKGVRRGTSLWGRSRRPSPPAVAFLAVKLFMEARLRASRLLPVV
jgi:hypothetical protein